MALVMLPCDLPWWPQVTKLLDQAAESKTSGELVDAMQRLYEMCNISLDPDEEEKDPNLFNGLARYLDKDLSDTERDHVLTKTIPRIVDRAKAMKTHKPPAGLHFSLQQQGDTIEHSYAFVASLIANAFFSTYPKRTPKTHPTLTDFNFNTFFKHLHLNSQKAKLRSIFYYFEFLEQEHALDGRLLISRQVLTKQWLTIEDWLESYVQLCPLAIRHEGRIERCPEALAVRVSFASQKIGDLILEEGANQESIQIATHPELLAVILTVEALEDNEAVIVEGLRQISRIQDPKNKAIFEPITNPKTILMCCIDAEDYSNSRVEQYDEDNVLREVNKSMLGFRQRRPALSPTTTRDSSSAQDNKRLSPIGESFSSPSPECGLVEHKREDICNSVDKQEMDRSTGERIPGNGASTTATTPTSPNQSSPDLPQPPTAIGNNSNSCSRKNVIVLARGEALPVTRKSMSQISMYGSCNSQSTDSFHSAQETIDEEPEKIEEEEEEKNLSRRYSAQLDTPERRGDFAQRLKQALRFDSVTSYTTTSVETSSESSSYAVGIDVSGSHLNDVNIKVKRGGGSTGFVLDGDEMDEEFLNASFQSGQKWLNQYRKTYSSRNLQRKDTNDSSKYSFSSEYSSEFCSELEEVYEQLSKWIEEPKDGNANSGASELDARDKAVVVFAGSLLKRALSESMAGVPVQEGEPQFLFDSNDVKNKKKLALAVRSLSLELARNKHKRQATTTNGTSSSSHKDSKDEDETFADGTQGNSGIIKTTKKSRLTAVAYTSEISQTLFEDETTIKIPSKKSRKKVSRENSAQEGELRPVVTGNWGCGSRCRGDPQLKLVIQWLAASMAGVPKLIYYTFGHSTLSKLDTVSRVLRDRQWSVGHLMSAVLKFSKQLETGRETRNSLFEELIGMDKPSP